MSSKMVSSNHPSTTAIPARKNVLFSAIAATCQEVGFHSADNFVLDILLQMFQAFLSELSHTAKSYSEHSGRSEPLAGDVYMALIEMGFNVPSLCAYAQRPNRIMIPNPSQQTKQQTPKILQTGKKKQLLSYIPDYFPSFPDSHSYIATPTYKQPITDYETLREKSSMQKRDVERALTRFMARTFHSSYTYSLFPDEQLSNLFPLIGIKVNNVPYLSALLPKDRIWKPEDNQFQSILQNTTNNNSNNKKPSLTTANDDSNKLNDLNDSKTAEADDPNEGIENPYLLPPKIIDIH